MTTLRTCWDRDADGVPTSPDSTIESLQIAVGDALESLLEWDSFYRNNLDYLRHILRRIECRLADEYLDEIAKPYLEYKRGCPESKWIGSSCRGILDLSGLSNYSRSFLLRCCRAYALTLRLLHLRERNMMISPKPAA